MATFFVLGFDQTALFEAGMQFSSGIKNRITQGLAVPHYKKRFTLVKYRKGRERRRIVFCYMSGNHGRENHVNRGLPIMEPSDCSTL